MAFTLPKLALPKLALPGLATGRKQMLTIAAGVVVLCALGWFGWQYFEDTAPPPPPPPPSKPQAVTTAKPPAAEKPAAAKAAETGAAQDKLIEDLLVASGLKQQLSQLPQKLIAGTRQSGRQRTKASPAVLKSIESAVTESYSAQGFLDRASAGLKKDFDEKRVRALLKDYSTPEAKRMIELDEASSPPEEFARFARSAAASRPAPGRASLIKRIDAATRASELAIDVAFASMKELATATAGGGATNAAAVDKAIDQQRAAASESIRNATLLNMAFSYRNASDDELGRYAEFYEAENSKWLTGILYTSVMAQVQSASAQAAERVIAAAGKPASPAAQPARSKAGGDARACLDLATNSAIAKCAEQYR